MADALKGDVRLAGFDDRFFMALNPVGPVAPKPSFDRFDPLAPDAPEATADSRVRALLVDLRDAEARYRTLVEELPLVTYIERLDEASASYISPQIEALVGFTADEWTSDPEFFATVLHEEDRERVLAGFSAMHATGERFDCEYRLLARDGRIVWIHDSAVVVRDESGRHLYAQGFLVDISERKHGEDALRDTEQRFRDLVSGIDVIVWEADPELNFSFVNKRAEDILGYPVERWYSDKGLIPKIVHPEDRERVLAADRGAIVSGEDYELEYRVLAADRRVVWFREIVRVEAGKDGRTRRLRGVMVDVTAQRKSDEARLVLEEQLRQSQKMEAVGQLAGGIAHDFNNLLTAICGYSEFALSRLDGTDAELRGDIEEIAHAGERAAQLTRQLLAFSRRQTLQPVVFDLNDAVSASENLLRRLLGEHVDILSSLTPQGCAINADRGQIEQVLINLAVNARDAMPGGGVLSLETERIRLVEGEAVRRFQAPGGEYVLLRVSDTGCGMDDDTRAHAFEPFFTTKALGEGTGLGLATVFGIVSQNAGFIALTSEPDAGATFEILLPLTTAPVAAAVRSSAPRKHVRGTERILLVEDDPVVRALTREILVGNGYDVIVASDGDEALGLSRDHPFDLLITDIVMPKLSGKELALRLLRAQPGLPVVYMSGYAHDTAGERLTADDTFIQKPFTANDLATTVRAKLDSARAPQALIA
jgi:two-component system, cell cycle sensor histidine kinase and response regulator CckA